MIAPDAFANAVTVAASIPNGLVLEFDRNPNGPRDEPLKGPIRIENNATIRLPQRSGLGVELDRTA